ncbi:uncharacterized protein LOC111264814 [Varroa jacobsoni]|uniref:Uncharacterized protein n=1 Tax=Varroa destructor TaxID=109461 RepID=A0A7M7ME89_VARDE|nr:uncharacterized protein LOC111253951 [Varroa destructor]XP_022669971.1 uncharacterized protein LOC111253951 [Varroa destructor]XP_022696724.1 uncharacterized protein LOC111264814 [Varroa jacobsoni]XP_022696725.1 uncharacterized protein LOC111264814 [Varroa jacobsoni]XP_022696727.1 uncharacterized protein LOC111264814 [Varroa jacobsoni]
MAEPRSRVLVDPETGNVLIVHRRSIGTGTILFFLALVSLIAAKYVDDGNYREAFYSFGALCCLLLMGVLIWRCCCCCCHPKHRTPGYVVVGGPQSHAGAPIQPQVNVTPNPGYPVAAAVQPVLTSYATPGVGTFAAPPFVAGIAPQPAYNPNMPPTQVQSQQQRSGNLQEASAPLCDAPPSYDEATAIPHKQ